MSSIDDKKLYLLGILLTQDAHGYQLNQQLNDPTSVIAIGKANAYKLLARMEDEGLVTHIEERHGKRPPRRTYSLTKSGEEEFQRLLRASVGRHQPSEYPNGVALNFIGLLDAAEASDLLRERQKSLTQRLTTLRAIPTEIRESHPGIEFMVRQSELEYEFTEELINRHREWREEKL